MPSPKYVEETSLYGQANSTSNFELEFGSNYVYSPNMTLDASLNFTSNKAKFTGTDEYNMKSSLLRIGTTFTF